jgi:hypothetical protein
MHGQLLPQNGISRFHSQQIAQAPFIEDRMPSSVQGFSQFQHGRWSQQQQQQAGIPQFSNMRSKEPVFFGPLQQPVANPYAHRDSGGGIAQFSQQPGPQLPGGRQPGISQFSQQQKHILAPHQEHQQPSLDDMSPRPDSRDGISQFQQQNHNLGGLFPRDRGGRGISQFQGTSRVQENQPLLDNLSSSDPGLIPHGGVPQFRQSPHELLRTSPLQPNQPEPAINARPATDTMELDAPSGDAAHIQKTVQPGKNSPFARAEPAQNVADDAATTTTNGIFVEIPTLKAPPRPPSQLNQNLGASPAVDTASPQPAQQGHASQQQPSSEKSDAGYGSSDSQTELDSRYYERTCPVDYVPTYENHTSIRFFKDGVEVDLRGRPRVEQPGSDTTLRASLTAGSPDSNDTSLDGLDDKATLWG